MLAASLMLAACVPNPGDADYDVIIRGGTVYDGMPTRLAGHVVLV